MSLLSLQIFSPLTADRRIVCTRSLAVQVLRMLAQLILLVADTLDVLAPDAKEKLKPFDKPDTEAAEVTKDTIDEMLRLTEVIRVQDQSRTRYDSLTSNSSLDSGNGDDFQVETDPETGLEVVSLQEVGLHCYPWDAWTVVYDKVYDVTEYLSRHPGGEEVMMEYIGYDSTIAFRGVGHSKVAFRALDKFLVGILPTNERLNYESEY